jgi:hypothetical protein
MGYHIILDIECIIKDEYIDNFNLLKKYFFNLNEDNEEDEDIIKKYNNIPENLQEYGDIWKSLKIWHHFNCCNLKENILKIRISKKPYRHEGSLENDYNTFIKDIIVPMSSLIINCKISHDDHDIQPTIFTDDELRNAKYINAYLIPSEKLQIQYGKRLQNQPKKQKDIDVSYIKIYPNIYESEPETWPKSLKNWWDNLSYFSPSKDDIVKISNDLKKYYGEDEELLKIAEWLAEMCKIDNIKFHFSYSKGRQ